MRELVKEPPSAESRPSTPSHLYSEDYYLTSCEGYEDFGLDATRGGVSQRLAAALALVDVKTGERVLDIGCGRGEAVLGCAQGGTAAFGIDYSSDALRISEKRMRSIENLMGGQIYLARADAKRLPFASASFDKLLMFDLVEHLYQWELEETLLEAWRVLHEEGQLIIHTAPNRWYYRYGYPLYRVFEGLRGRQLPADPRRRFPFHHLHVNEQDIFGLRRSLRTAGFGPKVWLDNLHQPLADENPLLRKVLLKVLLEAYPFRWVFRNDIFAIARKRA